MKLDVLNLMEQAKALQVEIEAQKKNAEKLTAVGESGAGMVFVSINGANRILSVKIADELINLSEKKMLEDLIVAAVNNAYQNISEATSREIEKLSSLIPNLSNFPNINL